MSATKSKNGSGKVSGPQTKKAYKIKTIDIQAREWFDKVNGNSYFSAEVVLNYGTPESKVIALGFQYGYGQHYVDQAMKELQKRGFIPSVNEPLWRYCDQNKIILRSNKVDRCKKRELITRAEAEQLNEQTK